VYFNTSNLQIKNEKKGHNFYSRNYDKRLKEVEHLSGEGYEKSRFLLLALKADFIGLGINAIRITDERERGGGGGGGERVDDPLKELTRMIFYKTLHS